MPSFTARSRNAQVETPAHGAVRNIFAPAILSRARRFPAVITVKDFETGRYVKMARLSVAGFCDQAFQNFCPR
jgi:hypothetical protein